jgi:hypothetical protein
MKTMKFLFVVVLSVLVFPLLAADGQPVQTIIKNVHIFDGHKADLKEGLTFIKNNLIKAVVSDYR